MKPANRRQHGFTLIELIVVVAILGILAAVTVPLVTGYLEDSKERSYEADKEAIQLAVDSFFSSPGNTRFLGRRQYPIIGRAQTAQASLDNIQASTSTNLIDDRLPFATSSDSQGPIWSPNGGIQGADLAAALVWVDDDSDGIRDVDAAAGTADSWNTVSTTRQSVTYQVDPRYYFIDFEQLKTDGKVKDIPDSASEDNRPSGGTGVYNGSYIWYVDDEGKVESLSLEFPDNTGYVSGVYP